MKVLQSTHKFQSLHSQTKIILIFGFFRVIFGFSGRVGSGRFFFGFGSGSGRVEIFNPIENSILK